MTKFSYSQKGSVPIVIIAILGVALIGALGFIFWQNFINRDPIVKNEPVVVTQDETKIENPQIATLSINEYKAILTIPTELSDTTIKYEARQIGEASFLAFTTQRVIDLGGDCAKGYPFGDLVTLSRDDQPKSSEYQVYTSEKIDGYYYHIGTVESSGLTPSSTCPAGFQAKNDLNALVKALKTLTAQN